MSLKLFFSNQYLLIFTVAFCWGIHPSLSKIGMSIVTQAYLLVLIQNILVLTGVILSSRLVSMPDFLSKKHIPFALVGAILNYGIAIPTMTASTMHLLISHMLLMIGLAPVLTYLIALILKNTTISATKLIGALISFIGLFILFYKDLYNANNINVWYGIILLTPIAFALQNNIIKIWARYQLHVIGLVFYQNLFAVIFISCYFLFFNRIDMLTTQSIPTFFPFLLALLALLHLSGQIFFYQLLKVANIVFSSQASNLSIIVGVMWAILVGHEPVSLNFFIALITTLYGVYLSQK